MTRRLARACALAAAAVLVLPAFGSADTKIVNGQPASIQDYPWQIAIYQNGTKPSDQICGGTIRDSRHVVTAAHCVMDDSSQDGNPRIDPKFNSYSVGYGSTNLATQKKVGVRFISVDPHYLRGHSDIVYDDAVLTLDRRIRFGDDGRAPQPVDYATEGEFNRFFHRGIWASGWGATSEGGPGPADNNLRAAHLPAASDDACRAEYGSDYIASLQFCAGGKGSDTCQGDSGGPITIDTDPGRGRDLELVGIVSGGHGCGRKGVPGYYAWVQSDLIHLIKEAHPDPAPRGPISGSQVIRGDRQVGEEVTCDAPRIEDARATEFVWWRTQGGNGNFTKFRKGPRTITLPQSTAGEKITCDVRYETDGGFFYADMPNSRAAGPIQPATQPGGGGTPQP